MAEMTPMMKQYLEIKKAYPDSILFFRLGDFYEMFDDDARLASAELDLTLTSRDHGKNAKPKEEQRPMCGVPYHACDAYVARLIAKGYKVAICEQVEDPAKAKGLVKRDILRVITPGTVMDAACLDDRAGNFLCALYLDEGPETVGTASNGGTVSGKADGAPGQTAENPGKPADSSGKAADNTNAPVNNPGKAAETTGKSADNANAPADELYAGAAFCDLTTGEVHVTQFQGPDRVTHLINELGRFAPAEAVLNPAADRCPQLTEVLREKFRCRTECGPDRFLPGTAQENIRKQFGDGAAERLADKEPVALALGALLHYLYETQKTDLSHLNQLDYYQQGYYMELDLAARRNLELTQTLRGKEKRGSLLWVLDRTKTPMGGRRLREWLDRPLLNVTAIQRRSGAVEAFVENTIAREELIAAMAGMGDMERLLGRIVYGTAGGRDMTALRSAMERLPEVRRHLSAFGYPPLRKLTDRVDTLEDLSQRIADTIMDEPPVSIRDGGFIRDGYDEEVDRLRHILKNGKGVIAEMEAREKEATGIRTLKIRYNKVFGYYIEVSNTFKDQVPDHYIRKQTLVNGERFITQELKDLEHTILTADSRVKELEYELFAKLREEVSAAAVRIQKSALAVAQADALASLAAVAAANRYCRPEVDESGVIEIHEGRHPVVERMLKDTLFVPNDTYMGEKEQRIDIITGPNMAGKSTYMRQVALTVLMAQIGSFVPASSARIGICDRIFTRIGASDDLSAGQSTFMVEMTEVADMLRAATSRSLLVLDEIGRGTSTYDGMSIARAVLEYCADRRILGARTLFATHYHELTKLADQLPGAVNHSIAVKLRGEEMVFLRKIVAGGADRSYGVEVARLAGLPAQVVRRARTVMKELEAENAAPAAKKEEAEPGQVSLESVAEGEVLSALRQCQLDTLTPIEAMGLLYEWKKKVGG